MSNITPAGYIYGREPLQTNPFWEMQPNKPDVEVMALQDKRWLGIEDFPADYSLTIDVSKVENKPNYRDEIQYALYQKEIDYLTIENASTVDYQNYIDTTVSGKLYTIKNSIIKLQKMFMGAKDIFEEAQSNGNEYDEDNIELLENLIIMAYGNKFTKEELEEELDQVDLMQEFFNVIIEANKIMTTKAESLTNSLQAKFGNVAK